LSHSNLDANCVRPSQKIGTLGRLFGNLEVRPKLMILHNVFFLILSTAIYFALIPRFEDRVSGAEARETALATQLFSEDKSLLNIPGMQIYEYREGSPATLQIPTEVRKWLDSSPGATIRDPNRPIYLYRKDADSGIYRSIRLPAAFYKRTVDRAKRDLLLVLSVIYALSVLLLEFIIMPKYVYRPLRILLDADRATQEGDTRHEMIGEDEIPGDEIGRIMRSRNATVGQLRKHEEELAQTLSRLEEVADDLKRKNAMLETAKRNLADQDRLVSLGMLSASVAHELNTPLSVLHGSIEKLIETVEDGPSQERLARMLRVTHRLRKISENLLDFARVRKQETEVVSVRDIIEESWELVAIDEKAGGVRFTDSVTPEVKVIGNQDRLVQVFVNLLRNALIAIKADGMIQVLYRRFSEAGQSWVAISVEDNGSGVPEGMLPQIFEAFVTSRLDSRGTGLGLTVAEGIIHQHGGTIAASNRPGGGARLEVRLRAAPTEVTP
jgi:signal transduction histidine kinase